MSAFLDEHVSLVKHIRHLIQVRRIGKDLVVELPAVVNANALMYYLSRELDEEEMKKIKVEEDGGVIRITVKDSADVYDELMELLYENRHAQ